jgi:uncharacterized membrane protein YgdD (TMEM256/DUF423 family)
MIRVWTAVAAVVGFVSVTGGAVGAHLAVGDRTAELLRTGALYGLAHGAVLVAVAAMTRGRSAPDSALVVAGWAFAIGVLLFSLSLFALALTGIGGFAVVTPFGGVGLLIGWAALGVHALRR